MSYNKGSEKTNLKRAALQRFWEKLLWVCIPSVLAATATLVSNPRLDSQFAIYSAAAVVALLGITLSNRRAEKEKSDEENELFKSALRALLRSELMRTHHHAVRDGHASTVDKEVMERTYQSYHRLGGNGIATNLHDEMMALPTKDD
nr:MAG TPA: minor structural protein [Caudoviricetes sp.]